MTRKIPEAGLDVLASEGVQYRIGQSIESEGVDASLLREGAAECRVLLSLLTEPIDRKLLKACPRLLGVANMAVGYDNIDVEAATELGIPVSNTPGVLTDTTADFIWAMLLSVARRIPEAHEYAHGGEYRIWGPNLFLGADVSRGGTGQPKTLGIVGYGSIGRAVAKRASGFDMKVLAYNGEASTEGTVSLDELLEESDFVTLHPPLNDETHHLIGARELRRMKRTAFLINGARGPIVDEGALVEALNSGEIAGCALDVFEEEPVIHPGLLGNPRAALFPHIASASHDTRGRMATMAATNAVAHLRAERAPNVVNPEVYESTVYQRRMDS